MPKRLIDTIRRTLSFAAFTTLVASLTLAFADSPTTTTQARFSPTQRAVSTTPRHALRLAQAKVHHAAATAKPSQDAPVDLNTATAEQLIALPGIGETKAARILEYRKKHGSFKRVVDLRRVKGFGRKTVSKLEPYLMVGGKRSSRK